MKVLVAGFCAGLLLAACSSSPQDQQSVQITTSPASSTSLAPEPPTTQATTTTTEVVPTTMSPADSLSYEVVAQDDLSFLVEITDVSGRNDASQFYGGAPDTLQPRPIRLLIKRALNADGSVVADRPMPLVLSGDYVIGGRPSPCWTQPVNQVVACVGFPYMVKPAENPFLPVAPEFNRDIPNHAIDVSRALDIILTSPEFSSLVDEEKVYYYGLSMGGLTGMMFRLPYFSEPRLKAIVSNLGTLPAWVDGFEDPKVWSEGPPMLMINRLQDNAVRYSGAKETFSLAQGSSNIEMVTLLQGDHLDVIPCPAQAEYLFAWIDHHVNGGPEPDRSVFEGSECAAYGPQEGGTSGCSAGGEILLPPEVKAKFCK